VPNIIVFCYNFSKCLILNWLQYFGWQLHYVMAWIHQGWWLHLSRIPKMSYLVNHLLIDLHVGPLVNGLFVGRIFVGQPLVMVVPPWHATTAKL
jgi:hypothetical protein